MFHTINCAARNLPLPPYAAAGIRTHVSRAAPSIRNLYSGYSTNKANVAELMKPTKTEGTNCSQLYLQKPSLKDCSVQMTKTLSRHLFSASSDTCKPIHARTHTSLQINTHTQTHARTFLCKNAFSTNLRYL